VKILHSFNNDGKDRQSPGGGLIFDASGNLYGTTRAGGAYGGGAVFKLSPKSGGWAETILHNFGNGKDGSSPAADLIFDSAGNLYGTATRGGAANQGTVFQLTPKSGGWAETILHSFSSNGTDGTEPESTPIIDTSGNLYGMTFGGGVGGGGTVFELTPAGGGIWTETILYAFSNKAEPVAGLIFDASGNLYGTTQFGPANGEGAVFELTPAGGGVWTETTLHGFNNVGVGGCNPIDRLIFDGSGNLYGTARACGVYGNGVVFEITPLTSLMGGEDSTECWLRVGRVPGESPTSRKEREKWGTHLGPSLSPGRVSAEPTHPFELGF